MTIKAFIGWSTGLEGPRRWDLHDGRPARRPTSWVADALVRGELLGQLHDALWDDPVHEVLGSGPLLVTGPATAVEPHLMVVPWGVQDPDAYVLRDSVVVVEVPRADNCAEHWLPRLAAHAALPTMRHVVAVHPIARVALHLRCPPGGADGGPATTVASGLPQARLLRGGRVALNPLPVMLDLDAA